MKNTLSDRLVENAIKEAEAEINPTGTSLGGQQIGASGSEPSDKPDESIDGVDFYFDFDDPEEMEMTVYVNGTQDVEQAQEKVAIAGSKSERLTAKDVDINDGWDCSEPVVNSKDNRVEFHMQFPPQMDEDGDEDANQPYDLYYELFDNDEENDIVRTADGTEYAVIDGITRGDRTAFLVGVVDKQLLYVGEDPSRESDGMEISSKHADAPELTEPVFFVRKDPELCQKLRAEVGEIELAD